MTTINPNTLFIGKNFVFLEKCASTNAYALDVLSSVNIAEGTVFCTNNQFEGKGQKGNTWESEPNKNLILSLVLIPKHLNPVQQFYLNKFISVTIVNFLNRICRQAGEKVTKDFEIKWPNDIYFENKKVGGLLIENSINKNSIQHSIIGVGLNVNQEKFKNEKAISLKNIINDDTALNSLLESFCETIEANYLKFRNNIKYFDREYLDLLYKRGDLAMYSDKDGRFEGEIIGVDDIGMLVIKKGEALNKYNLKEIVFE